MEKSMGYNAMTREQRIKAADYVERAIVHAQRYRNCPIDLGFLKVIGGVPAFICRVQQVEACFDTAVTYSYSVVVREGGAALTAVPQSVTVE